MSRRPFYLSDFSYRNVPSLKFGMNVRPSHGRDCLELDCTNRLQARQKRQLQPIAGQDGAWLCCAIWCREKTGFPSLASKPDSDAATADIKMMNRRSSLFGRVKNSLCSIKDQCAYHIFRLFITFQTALKPA